MTIESHLQPARDQSRDHQSRCRKGLRPANKTNYDIVRRQLWLAYRDAAQRTEIVRLHEAGSVRR